ncbi:hypothetical protein DY000_02055059 [Brassica cretica]|uniref:Uncharacterized protein n=1 Tax=Brassica cretica TaxID=69181 RepID=A0ABQ7ACV2_BRACR|nr:hypothetical protein DY000_02055059 [Brassica cretica]
MAQTKLNVNAIAKKIQKMYIEESYKPQENNKTESILETEELIKPRRRRRGRGNRGFSAKCYSVYFTSMFLTREREERWGVMASGCGLLKLCSSDVSLCM